MNGQYFMVSSHPLLPIAAPPSRIRAIWRNRVYEQGFGATKPKRTKRS